MDKSVAIFNIVSRITLKKMPSEGLKDNQISAKGKESCCIIVVISGTGILHSIFTAYTLKKIKKNHHAGTIVPAIREV